MQRPLLLLWLTALTFCATPLFAQDKTPGDIEVEKQQMWQQFENLVSTVNSVKQELNVMRAKLPKARTPAEKEQITAEINRLSEEIDSLQLAWEMWATGGVDVQLFAHQQTAEKFDWKDEIQSVFEPILVELRRLTERPRKIERLRSEQIFYQQRVNAAAAALKSVSEYKKTAPANLVHSFKTLETRWKKRHDDLKNRLNLINFELNELLAPSKPSDTNTGQMIQDLLSGRIANLFMALSAGVVTYGLLILLKKLYVKIFGRLNRKRGLLSRVSNLLYLGIAFILSILACMAVLYVKGDWILLGLLLILLVAAVLTLQRSIPTYLAEMRLLLNLGPVREGQRIIYAGLPWQIQSLNVYTTLHNPLLRGGRIQVPVNDLCQHVSRRYDDNEPWFPSHEQDFVLLSDDTFGRVILQSPEIVQLRTGGAIRTLPVADYLSKCPQNLTRDGFAIAVPFGLDYSLQPQITTEIREKFEQFVRDRLAEGPLAAHLQELSVEFNEAAPSSLDLIIMASFSGEAADQFRRVRRVVQKIAVDCCNHYGWSIPFTTMTVHLADNSMTNQPLR